MSKRLECSPKNCKNSFYDFLCGVYTSENEFFPVTLIMRLEGMLIMQRAITRATVARRWLARLPNPISCGQIVVLLNIDNDIPQTGFGPAYQFSIFGLRQ